MFECFDRLTEFQKK